jgi:hypothetical protein
MTDLENREVLRTIMEVIKTQMVYFRNLHEAYQAFYDAVTLDRPELQPILQAEMGKIRGVPSVQSHLDALDDMLRLVENSQ